MPPHSFSAGWLLLAGGDAFGDLGDRLRFMAELAGQDRLQFAFVVDCALYTLFQNALVGDERAALLRAGVREEALPPAALCATPFFGLAAWLLARPPMPEASAASASSDAAKGRGVGSRSSRR